MIEELQNTINELKIDKSFVDNLLVDDKHKGICAAIISLAKPLNCQCVAEGVETEAQYTWLEEQGCNFSQGYLHSKPLPFDELLELLGLEKD